MEKSVVIKTNKLCKSFSNGGVLQHVLRNIDLINRKFSASVISVNEGKLLKLKK